MFSPKKAIEGWHESAENRGAPGRQLRVEICRGRGLNPIGGALCASHFVWRQSRNAVAPRQCRKSKLTSFGRDTPSKILKVHSIRFARYLTSRCLTRQHNNVVQGLRRPRQCSGKLSSQATFNQDSNATRRLPCLIKQARAQQRGSLRSGKNWEHGRNLPLSVLKAPGVMYRTLCDAGALTTKSDTRSSTLK